VTTPPTVAPNVLGYTGCLSLAVLVVANICVFTELSAGLWTAKYVPNSALFKSCG